MAEADAFLPLPKPASKKRQRAAPEADKEVWHLICVTRLGKVSMLRDLDLLTARETYKRLRPDKHPEKWVFHKCLDTGKEVSSWSSYGGRSYGPHDDWLERVDAIGPKGAELNPWHGVKPHIRNVHCECGCRYRAAQKLEAEKLAKAAAPEAMKPAKKPLDPDEKRWRDLFRAVPSAFWLDPDLWSKDDVMA